MCTQGITHNTQRLCVFTPSKECVGVLTSMHVCDVCVNVYACNLCVGECRVTVGACVDVVVCVLLINSLYVHQVMSVSMCMPMSTCVVSA